MPQALRVERAQARSEAELQRLLAECRGFSGEFPDFLANHLPMVLVAMHRLGGSDERLNAFFATYRDNNRLSPPPVRVAPIARENWDASLGDRARESDYIAFFLSEVARLGARAAIAAYLPTLLPGLAASATHGLMRLAYGVLREDDAEIATALGYWAATYLELGVAGNDPPLTDDPAEVLLWMRPVASFRHVETELDLLWHFMRAMAAKPEFSPVGDWLAIGPDTANAHPRGIARALCRNHGFLRTARRHRLPLAQDVAPCDARSCIGVALFLAGDRLALSQDRLSRIA